MNIIGFEHGCNVGNVLELTMEDLITEIRNEDESFDLIPHLISIVIDLKDKNSRLKKVIGSNGYKLYHLLDGEHWSSSTPINYGGTHTALGIDQYGIGQREDIRQLITDTGLIIHMSNSNENYLSIGGPYDDVKLLHNDLMETNSIYLKYK